MYNLSFFRNLQKHCFRALADFSASGGVNQTIAGNMKQPRLRLFRDAFRWPAFQRGNQRVTHRIFRPRDVVRPCREIHDELPIRIAQNGFNYIVRRQFTHGCMMYLSRRRVDGRKAQDATAKAAKVSGTIR